MVWMINPLSYSQNLASMLVAKWPDDDRLKHGYLLRYVCSQAVVAWESIYLECTLLLSCLWFLPNLSSFCYLSFFVEDATLSLRCSISLRFLLSLSSLLRRKKNRFLQVGGSTRQAPSSVQISRAIQCLWLGVLRRFAGQQRFRTIRSYYGKRSVGRSELWKDLWFSVCLLSI